MRNSGASSRHTVTAVRVEQSVANRVGSQITKGASRQQKADVVKDITDSLVRVLGKKPEHIHIVIQEIEEEDWGYEAGFRCCSDADRGGADSGAGSAKSDAG